MKNRDNTGDVWKEQTNDNIDIAKAKGDLAKANLKKDYHNIKNDVKEGTDKFTNRVKETATKIGDDVKETTQRANDRADEKW